MQHERKKVVIIGLDGATFDLILPFVEQGHLPAFKKLIKGGSWGYLDSGPIPHTAIAWPSFFTGKNMGKHGIYDFYLMDRSSDRNQIKHINSRDCDQEYLWETISRQKGKVFVINVPMCYPPSEVNGVFVSGFQTPPGCEDYVYPAHFKKKLDSLCDGYEILPHTVSPETDLLKYFEGAKEVADKQFKVIKHILLENDWDCLIYVFREIDSIQHFSWHYLDNSHPDFKENKELSKLPLGYYKIIDNYLGELLNIIDEDTILMIMSDHGMGAQVNSFNLDNWLIKEGYLKLKGGIRGVFRKLSFGLDICEGDLYNLFIKNGPIGKIREFITKKKTETKTRCFYKFKDIDWARTRAYALGVNQLFINLKGREPEGIVEKGKQYEDLMNELIGELKEIDNPIDGSKLCTKIYRKSEIFSGEKLEHIPDIIIECSGNRCVSPGGYKIASSKIFDSHRQKGGHRREGVFIIYGGGVRPGNKLDNINIMDLTPTALSLLGLGIPKDCDGKIITSAFTSSDCFTKNFIEPVYKNRDKREYSREENEKIEERLKSLGYL